MPKNILLDCKKLLLSSFDLFVISKVIVSVPSSSIVFQASQSEKKLLYMILMAKIKVYVI